MKEKKTNYKKCMLLVMLLIFVLVPVTVLGAQTYKLNAKEMKLNVSSFTYTGKVQRPSVKVFYNKRTLKKNKDYTVRYSGNCKDVGTHKVIVTGKGKYRGVVEKGFKINPIPTSIRYISPLEQGTKLNVVWAKKKMATNGYVLQYSTCKQMTRAQTIYIRDRNSISKTLTKLKPGTTYYVRVRTSALVKGKRYYSKWSGVKSCKTSGVEKPTPIPVPEFSFVRDSVELEKGEVGKYFALQTTNKVKNISFSNPEIVHLYHKDYRDKNYINFYCAEPGTTTITLTDNYGQSIKKTMHITQKLQQKGVGEVMVTSLEQDFTLPKPVMEDIVYLDACIGLEFLGSFSPDDPYEGFELQVSTDKNFLVGELKEDYVNERLGDKYGSAYIGLGYKDGITYYYRARAYKIRGSVKVVGAWTDPVRFDIAADKIISGKPKYSYEFYFLDKETTEMYTDSPRIFYVKTDNPDPNTFMILKKGLNYESWGNWRDFYEGIEYHQETQNKTEGMEVDGGYVGCWWFKEAGTAEIEIREESLEGYKIVKTFPIKVRDTKAEKEAWMKEVIAKATTPDMDPFDKISAICHYILYDLNFKYPPCTDVPRKRYVSHPMMESDPFFVKKRWDSFISPREICEFAKMIGGFDDIHNCYYDYPVGSQGWESWHAIAKLTIGDEVRSFSACPLFETGLVDKIETVDFNKTEKFRKIG